MQTVNAQTSTPTHVAFFASHPEDRVHFSAAGLDSAVQSLMQRHPGEGIPTIRELTLAAVDGLDSAKIAASVAREGSDPVSGLSTTLTANARHPVCPRCLDVEPGKPAGDPAVAHPGPFAEQLCEPCEVDNHEKLVKERGISTWTMQVVDPEARARIDAQQQKLAAAGISGFGRELFATGTRMADVGYATQAQRAVEHGQKMPLRGAAEALIERVRSERRTDLVVTARELASQVTINGALKLGGLKLQEQAIRGLLMRAESPAAAYVFGLRDRIADSMSVLKSLKACDRFSIEEAGEYERRIISDRRKLAGVLAHELEMAGDVEMKLRTRAGLGDVFAAVSPKYSPADAPQVLAQVLKGLPGDAKGSWSYDPVTTSWELRAEVWTPTPVAEQAVGEPFRGYVSFRSKDNGTGSLNGGGGIEILACLNASTYVADSSDVNRRHIGKIVAEVEAMVAKARRSIDVLCEAWGVARQTDLSPAYEAQVGLTLSQAIPGFWWGEIRDQRSALYHVLRGSSKHHVAGLTDATLSERAERSRGSEPLTKGDLAQGWTKYVQRLPSDVRRDAESAAASWVVSQRPVCFDAERVEQ